MKARETGRHLRVASVDVLLAVDLLLRLVQQLQHFTDNGLQRTSQVFLAVRLSERRHVNEGGAAAAQVQGRVVGEVTEIPRKGSHTTVTRPTKHSHRLLLFFRLLKYLPASLETDTATPRPEEVTLLQTDSMSMTEVIQSGPPTMQHWESGQKLLLSRPL